MAKSKKTVTEEDIFAQLAQACGGQLLGDDVDEPVLYSIDSGNLAVNYVISGKFIGGGYPGGRIIEILGPSMGGKSLWASNFARGIQLLDGAPVYLDTEGSLDSRFAIRVSHLDPMRFVKLNPTNGIECLEKVFLKMFNVMKAYNEKYPERALGIVYDSIAVSPSARELRETDLSENFTKTEWKSKVGAQEQPGERAKICNREFRKLQSVLPRKNTTLLVINQIRHKIGVMYGNPEVGSTASSVLEFYSTIRLRLSAHKKIETKHGRSLGVNLKVRNIKNKLFTPFLEASDIKLFYETGIDPLSGLLVLMEQIERIESVGKGMYKVKEPWAGGQEVTFRATKEANKIDADVLYKCPALIDAKDEQQVKDYLSVYGEVINQSDNMENVEKLIDNEGDEE